MKRVWTSKTVSGLTEWTRSVSVSPDGGVTVESYGIGPRGGARIGAAATGFTATEWAEIASAVAHATTPVEPLVIQLDTPANANWLQQLRAQRAKKGGKR